MLELVVEALKLVLVKVLLRRQVFDILDALFDFASINRLTVKRG